MSTFSDHNSMSAEDIFSADWSAPGQLFPSPDADIGRQNSMTLDSNKPAPAPAPRQPPPPPPSASQQGILIDLDNDNDRSSDPKARRMPPPPSRPGGPSASPSRRPPPPQPQPQRSSRARRNSDSSILDFDTMPLTEEEKRMIARRRERERQKRDAPKPPAGPTVGATKAAAAPAADATAEKSDRRDARERRERDREGKTRSKSGRPNRRVDIIDQLDATGIYGTGLFHHDGPFDALNPHRNRNTSRRAPMQAFPKDSLNNSLGGSGPLNNQADHTLFMGQGDDDAAFRDYASKRVAAAPRLDGDVTIFNPTQRIDAIHGDESEGLGTSTFLEGAPAARSAITRDLAERQQQMAEGGSGGGGLQRKKSLAQRLRMNKGGSSGHRVMSPDAYGGRSASVGTTARGDPFAEEFSRGAGEESLSLRPRERAMSPDAPVPAPRRRAASGAALERRSTADASMTNDDGAAPKPSGILGRMKSLKGGRRPARTAESAASPPPPTNHGAAM
ncbi:Pal1 cell morphology protein [Geosmithia morbida]|uniref:Pal1 cell morphology protein n=1 Tax=Geosmithia morbida TaxID=1094350 RepID=A0A9P4YZ48_9HYPO|nr:Pal1 cell morphology protein [Geosmithia morbida]KAF4124705.1 Pal1 cell morphology protein [Geosmithia morbida]